MLLINPETGEPISPVTLRKHFRQELDSGHAVATSKVAQSLFKNATTATETYPGGIPVAQIFWMKSRAGWQAKEKGLPPPSAPPNTDIMAAARRILFALELGAAQAAGAPPAPAPRKREHA